MTTPTVDLLSAARAALTARREQQAIEQEAAFLVRRKAATDAVKAVLGSLTLSDLSLKPVHTDVPNGVVVWSDGKGLGLAVRVDASPVPRTDVRLVAGTGADWTFVGDPIRSLADAALMLERHPQFLPRPVMPPVQQPEPKPVGAETSSPDEQMESTA